MSVEDAARAGCMEGDIVRVTSRRGRLEVPVRVGDIRPGTVFAPFHYGYWDAPDGGTAGGGSTSAGGAASPARPVRAANELTITEWDPVSKQPVFKNAAVRVERLRAGDGPSKAPATTASRPATGGQP
jgi:anaerobic selenocysteine-containing dehydrogenase